MSGIGTVRKMYRVLTPAERRGAAALFGLMLIGMVLETLGLGLVIPVLGLLLSGSPAELYPELMAFLGGPSPARLVTMAMAGLIVVYLFKAAFLAFLAWRQMRFAFGVQAELSQQLFARYLKQPYTFHLQRNSAQLIRNAIGEVNMFTFSCMLPGLLLLTELLVLLGVAGLLLAIEPVGAGVVFVTLGVSSWTFHKLTRAPVARWGEARQRHEGLRIQYLQEGLGGVKDAQLLGREDNFLALYQRHNLAASRVGRAQHTLGELPRIWLEFLGGVGLALLVTTLVGQGQDTTSIVTKLGLFAAAAFRLMPSVSRVLGALHSVRYAVPVIDTLHTELTLAVPEGTRVEPAGAPFQQTIALNAVSYVYPDTSAPAIHDVSLVVRRGEAVGLIGPSGCGKSTAIDVLLGLLPPASGRVEVDGRSIQGQLRGWQDQIGHVPQTVFLTDDTLRRNIAFGLPDEQIDRAALQRAVQAAQLESFVASLPDGLETVVGERGVRLSGGQHQRIGIARALYNDPAVLVLDEATSSLDTATERGVMEAVTALHGKKTVIIVAHRLSTVEQCDRLYRFEQGTIVEQGRPSDVLVASEATMVAGGSQ